MQAMTASEPSSVEAGLALVLHQAWQGACGQ